MKKNVIALIIFALTIVIGAFSIMMLNRDTVKYTINYTYNNDLYVIKIYENKVMVDYKEQIECIKAPCEGRTVTFRLNFSEENLDKVYDVVEELFGEDEKIKDIKSNSISAAQSKILNAVIINDESSLKEKEPQVEDKPISNKELVFSIKSGRINCDTVTLKVYEDKTYELYTSHNETVKPKNGTYKYDVNKIIQEAQNYEDDKKGPFTLTKKNGETLKLYSNNRELKEFLDEIKVNLDTCTTYAQ